MGTKRRKSAKQKELAALWEALCKKHGVEHGRRMTTRSSRKPLTMKFAMLELNKDRLPGNFPSLQSPVVQLDLAKVEEVVCAMDPRNL